MATSVSYDVVVVGSCMRDLTSFTTRLPKPGETIHGNRFTMGFGGKGANQCVVATRMGARTALVANLGDDDNGSAYYKHLKSERINVERVTFTDYDSSGIACILVDDKGQNCIVITAGANNLITPDEVEEACDIISRCSVLVCQWEIPMDVNLAALRLAKRHGATTVFNAAPAKADIPNEVFTLSDVFCVNETEAEIILNQQVSNVDEAKVAVKLLLERGCNNAIVTLGEKGVVFCSNFKDDCTVVDARKVNVVDTTGAGDAFVGALAYYLSKNKSLPMSEIVQRASHVASISVQGEGTQSSFPHRRQIPEELFF